MELKFEDYQTLLKGEPNKELLETEIFKEYRKEFDKWSEIKNRKRLKSFKELSKERQEKEINKRFIAYLTENENEKLYYFVLASQNPQKVLIVKSPSKNTEMKEFLGYEWSAAKGNEGIKYLGGVQLDKMEGEDEDEGNVALDEEDKRVLSNIFNLNNINTPLYDPQNKKNVKKINYLINEKFKGNNFNIYEELKPFVIESSLIDMLDFSKVDFNKSFSLTPKSTVTFDTIWNTKKLSDLAIINPSKTEIKNLNDSTTVSFVEMASVSDEGYIEEKEERAYKELRKGSYTYFAENDIILAKITPCMENGKCAIAKGLSNKIGFGSSEFHVIRVGSEIMSEYLFELLNQEEVRKIAEKNMTGSSGHRRVPKEFYESLKIPLPSIEVQTQLVNDCNMINKNVEKARKIISDSKRNIESLFQEGYSKANSTYRISDTDLFELSIGKRVLKDEINNEEKGIPVYSANVFEPFGHIEKELLENFEVSSVLWGIDGDWMVNVIPAKEPFYPTDHCGVLRIKSNKLHPKYLAWVLQKEGERVRFSRTNRASMDSMRGLTITAPSEKIQTGLIKKVEKLEKKIKDSQDIIDGIAKRKEAIIKYYLMGEASEPELAMAAEPKTDYNKK